MTISEGLKRRWKVWIPLAALAVLIITMVLSGFTSDIATAVYSRISPVRAEPPDYYGPTTLEERIILSDVVARVKMRSVSQTTERYVHYDDAGGPSVGESYEVALEFTFDALEYLKGSGGSTLTAFAADFDVGYETSLGASTLGRDLLSERDGRWSGHGKTE